MRSVSRVLPAALFSFLSACLVVDGSSGDGRNDDGDGKGGDGGSTECLDAAGASLFARSTVLWPMVGGTAEVRVCWDDPILGSDYPLAAYQPDLEATLARSREWVQSIAETEWNGRTQLRFVGWQDCADDPDADVRIVLTDSSVLPPCGDADGMSCVEALGTDLRGGSVYINLFFGEEVLYSSRYQQSHPGGSYDPNDDMAYWFIPQACLDEFRYSWSENNTLTSHPVDPEDPAVLAELMSIYETCAKNITLHELGHVAGFAHEQLRTDPEVEACRDLITERGLGQDWLDPAERYLGDTPLGVFDAESIMSYCRTDPSATLTATDVAQAAVAYPPPVEPDPDPDPDPDPKCP